MRTARLIRIDDDGERTLGVLDAPDGNFSILEPPWRGNARSVSCIPTGSYDVDFLPRSGSGKYRNVWWVRDVPGRGGILIHNGVVVDHTEGCLLIGDRHHRFAGKAGVWNSRAALRRFNAIMGRESFRLEVVNA